jgi:Predicted esterase of the alpha-beta hydrolase superfamily
MTTAFVLSGGGSLGAVQVGMLQALGERGVVPDLLVGTSAGAINAAFVGGHGMPPLWPLKVSAADFSHADELIARAKKATGL